MDWSPFVTPSADVPAVVLENNSNFSAADLALFAQAAGPDATSIVAEDNDDDSVRSGLFVSRNSFVMWGRGGDNQFQMNVYSRGGNSMNDQDLYGGAVWQYDGGELFRNSRWGILVTKAVFVPLTRNAAGNVETYRVDIYKTVGSNADSCSPSVELSGGGFAFERQRVALRVLVTERVVGNVYVETIVRIQQSADELALIAYINSENEVVDDDPFVFPGSFYFNYNDADFEDWNDGSNDYNLTDSTYPVGNIADIARRGLITDSGSNAVAELREGTLASFDFDRLSTMQGAVYHARVPLAFMQLSTPPNTLGAAVPLWLVSIAVAAVLLSLLAMVSRR